MGGEALSRAEPPAGPPKMRTSSPESTFHEIFDFLGCMPGPVLAKYSAQRNSLEAFTISLDRFWSKEGSDKFSANSVM